MTRMKYDMATEKHRGKIKLILCVLSGNRMDLK
jgi:hypothetical protein